MNNGGISTREVLIIILTLCLMRRKGRSVSCRGGNGRDDVLQTVTGAGIMNGDENGNMNLSAGVTREQLPK
jgi:hypothetical protein